HVAKRVKIKCRSPALIPSKPIRLHPYATPHVTPDAAPPARKPLPQHRDRLYNPHQMTEESHKTDRYNAREAEARWQQIWAARRTFETANSDPRPKYYVLEMFPYPSGRI